MPSPQWERLERWLEKQWPDVMSVQVVDVGAASSGYSAETQILDLEVDDAGGQRARRVVLRREQPQRPVYPVQADPAGADIALQYRVMEALAGHGAVPVAPLIGYESDADVLGAPFFAMEFVEGKVPIETPPYTADGFFLDATPDERTRLVEGGIRALRGFHELDWRTAGMEWLARPDTTPGTAHQLGLWRQYADDELGQRRHPLIDEAFAWLADNVPDDPEVVLCWGDPRPGNIIWQDFRCAALTDFEGVHLGAPEQDLGWWLMFDRTMHPDGSRLDGDPSRSDQRQLYRDLLGRDLVALEYHEVFAATRYAVIVVRVTNGWMESGDLPADHGIWLENPAVTCLADVLAEHASP